MTRIRVSLTNEDEGYIFSEFEEETPLAGGDLFRDLMHEFGRCISKLHRDPDGRVVGWVFESRNEYEDSRSHESYIRHAWVEVLPS